MGKITSTHSNKIKPHRYNLIYSHYVSSYSCDLSELSQIPEIQKKRDAFHYQRVCVI